MRAIVGTVLVILSLAGPAAAQDWIVQGSRAEGWTGATACAPGRDGNLTAMCLSIGCPTGLGLSATLSVSDATLPPELEASIVVDGEVAGVLDFRRDGSGITYGAPLDEQDRVIETLRTGGAAEVRLGFAGGRVVHFLSLSGSRAAIDTVLERGCPMPAAGPLPADLLGQPPETRTSGDPAAEAVAENEAFCSGGAASVDAGFRREADVDGDGLQDVILDYVGLACDGSRPFCGSGGCTMQVWLVDPAGGYRLLVSSLIEEIALPAPGAILFRLDGAECSLAGAALCERTYEVRNGTLVLKD